MAYIYLIRNTVNGKGYVGQTLSTIAARWSRHKQSMRDGSGGLLHKAIRKYGVGSFTVNQIVECAPELLNDLERYFVKFYGTFSKTAHGYNLTEGGDGSPGCIPSDLTRRRMAEAKQGNKLGSFSEDHRQKIAIALKGNNNGRGKKGQTHSEATRERLSKALKGRVSPNKGVPMSEAAKRHLSIIKTGKIHSAETRERLSKALKGKIVSEQTKAKIRATLTGTKRSPEIREKIAATLRARNAKLNTSVTSLEDIQ